MIKDLSILIKDKHKDSYFKSIKDLAAELTQITSNINSNVNLALERAVNNIKIVNDAKKSCEQILGIFESTQENLNLARFNFINSYEFWLNNVLSVDQTKTNSLEPKCTFNNLDTNQNETVIVLDDTNASEVQIIEDSSDIQIVNEIKYVERYKAYQSCSNSQKNKQSNGIYLSHAQANISKANSNLDIQNNLSQDNNELSFMDISFEAVANNVEHLDLKEKYLITKSDCSKNDENQENVNTECNQENNFNDFELSNNNQDYVILKEEEIKEITDVPLTNLRIKCLHYSDKKLRLRCFVQLDSLCEQNLKICTSHEKKSKLTLKNDALLRLIDLSGLERKTNKRRFSSSDDSSSSTSGKSTDSVKKRKIKRQKVCSDDSDVTSFYESSNSDTDNDLISENENFDQPITEKLDNNEEKALLLLLNDSDTSDDSDVLTDNDQEQCNDSTKKRNLTKKKSSDSKKLDKKKSSVSTWQNDELLRFKLPDDKNLEKRSFIEVNNLESTSGSDKKMRDAESINSLPTTNSEEIESNAIDNEKLKDDLQTITNTPKIAGRRNIRKVLDDQDITEITREAVKDEENRIQRLVERKKQLNSLLGPEDNLDKNSLTLDFDFKTKKKLVEVDRGLVKLLKNHQKEGVRFMWDCCFESLKEMTTEKGTGCILAHCMGLGKTLQVITLTHTLLSNDAIGIKTIMIVCPMNTILNWVDEFDTWLEKVEKKSNIEIIELTQVKEMSIRIKKLENWQKNGGVLIISYDMLVASTSSNKKLSPLQVRKMYNLLINPGADVVVCDEGHLLKNEKSKRADRMQSVKTQRRIILTGTPLQNNLNEYHCMVEFVKPHLLGSKAEFLNRFGNPIVNGQFGNSTPHDVKLMKHRSHVLHRLLEGCVQRRDYKVLTPLLPSKQEYVISVPLSEIQKHMYQHFISNVAHITSKQSCLFKNYQEIKRLVAHPKTMQLKMQRRKQPINHDDQTADSNEIEDWWLDFIKEEDLEDMTISNKLVLLFGLLESCTKKEDKVLVFSQCLLTLDLIELFLKKLDGQWKRGFDYFRLDGSVDSSERSKMCKEFNDSTKKRARLFLISTKAGGLGINLTGANRVVVFDPSWNPSNDLQSIFRVFRFGQKKPCYVYRFLTAGTMEEKIYIRQVTKLSLSLRVLDEQQVGRHYRDTDLMDLYKLEQLQESKPLNRPRDDLLAEVFSKYSKYVYEFFEHDSLLENQEEEELNEEERKQAWIDYHQENLAQPNNDPIAKSKVNHQCKKFSSETCVDSNMVSDTTAAPSKEITDLSN